MSATTVSPSTVSPSTTSPRTPAARRRVARTEHPDLAVLSGHSADELAEVQLILTQPASSVLYGHDA